MPKYARQGFVRKNVDKISHVLKAEEAENENVRGHGVTRGPVLPPATKDSIETQTGPQPEPEEPGSPHQKTNMFSRLSTEWMGTEEQKKDINVDDTAPEKAFVTLDDHG